MTRRDTFGELLASSERISLIITGTKGLESHEIMAQWASKGPHQSRWHHQ